MSVVALSTVSLLYGIKKSTSPEAAVCMGYTQGTLSRFRAVGQYPVTASMVPYNAARTPATPFGLTLMDISDANRWTGVEIMDTSAPPRLNNYQMINSAVNAVMATYNSSAATICTGPNGLDVTAISNIGRLAVPDALKQGTHQVFFHITPYDIHSGATIGCTHPLDILPTPARKSVAGSFVATSVAPPLVQNYATGPTKMSNVGFLFRVSVNYQRKVESGFENDNCFSEARFQYEADQTPPAYPDLFSVSVSNVPLTNQNSVVIQMGYSANRMKRGSVLVCRDRSMYPPGAWAPGNAAFQNAAALSNPQVRPCYNIPPGVGGTVQFNVLGSNFPTVNPRYFPSTTGAGNTNTTGLRYDVGAFQPIGAWGPCESMTVCGSNPVGPLIANAGADNPYLTTIYNNVPTYCRVRVEVGVVDTARNARTNDVVRGGGPTIPNNAFPVAESVILDGRDIFYPGNTALGCTQWCMNTDSSPYPDGYWIMSGTCPF